MKTKYLCKIPDDLNIVADKLLNNYPSNRIFAFYGKMGVGKTTLIKAICKNLKVADIVTSPTFSIINEYKTNDNNSIFHFDLYRLKNINEFYDIGYEDYFFSDSYCFIEWPEKIQELLPCNYVKIQINQNETNNDRIIEF